MNYDLKIEAAVLGAAIIDPSCLISVKNLFKEDVFYEQKNKIVCKAISEMNFVGETIDLLTITKKIQKMDCLEIVGGAFYISSLTNSVASAHNIESHLMILTQMRILRDLESLGETISSSTKQPSADPFEIIESVNRKIGEYTSFVTNNTKSVGDIFINVVDEIKTAQSSKNIQGTPSGISKLDSHTGGWQNGTLIVLAARPGMGKTATALQFAKFPAITLNKPVLIFSLEMTANQLVGRLAASESSISSSRINQKSITESELRHMGAGCHKLIDAPIYIDDTPGLKFSDIRARAMKMKSEKKIGLIVVDYLQLMHGEQGGNREQEISHNTRGLKNLSKELDLPIIVLSQLSREVEKRADKRPQLSDLRESGAIEQDADIVMFLWRPEYYGLHDFGYEYGGRKIDVKNFMLIDLAKGREVGLAEVATKFYGEYMVICDFESDAPNNNDGDGLVF